MWRKRIRTCRYTGPEAHGTGIWTVDEGDLWCRKQEAVCGLVFQESSGDDARSLRSLAAIHELVALKNETERQGEDSENTMRSVERVLSVA